MYNIVFEIVLENSYTTLNLKMLYTRLLYL